MIVWILVMIGVVAVDFTSKQLVLHFLDKNEPLYLIDDVLRFTYVENRGAAFGMLDEHRWVFMIVSTVAIAAMLFYLIRYKPESKLACLSLSLIIGGGVGNMIDRVAYGFVVDFIDFCAFPKLWMWVFNVADACVCIGAGLLILYLVIELVKESRMKKSGEIAEVNSETRDVEEK